MIQTVENTKTLVERFDKDVKGALNALLIIGIIVKEKRVWSYQIKKALKNIYQDDDIISNSSLYSLLGRLENDYKIITSEKDEYDQRRYFKATDRCKEEFEESKRYWLNIMNKAERALKILEED